jgi:serine/threonine protein kinase
MAKLQPRQLLDNIVRSGLVDSDHLAFAMERYDPGADVSRSPIDGKNGTPRAKPEGMMENPSLEDSDFEKYATPEAVHLSSWLTRQQQLITPWQREQLLKGRYKGFFLREYKLLGLIAVGGMARIYLAEHALIGRRVAIKVLPRTRLAQTSCLERFQREAQSAATLDHPNIIRTYDTDADEETHYIVMEFIDGRDLQKRVTEDGRLSEADAVDCIRQAAEGLGHAHQIGLLHRDVKPSNLLIDMEGTVKLLDLGLARFEDDQRAALTLVHDDGVLGTADFLAPEQAIDSHNVDARADIYGLGCTLYFALTGEPPYPEGTLAKRILQHQKASPPSPREKMPDVSVEVDLLCRKMTAKRPEDRFQDAFEVADALAGWMIRHGRASEESFISLTALRRRPVKRHDVSRLPATYSDTVENLPTKAENESSSSLTSVERSTSVHATPDDSDIILGGSGPGKRAENQAEWADDVPLPSMDQVETDELLESFFSELREDAVSHVRKSQEETESRTETSSKETDEFEGKPEEQEIQEETDDLSESPDRSESLLSTISDSQLVLIGAAAGAVLVVALVMLVWLTL